MTGWRLSRMSEIKGLKGAWGFGVSGLGVEGLGFRVRV